MTYFCDWVNHPALKVCNSVHIQDYFKWFSVLRSSEVIHLFLIKLSILKAIEIEITYFHSLGNPKDQRLVISFVLKISVIFSPTN